jgi:hypothetical protein
MVQTLHCMIALFACRLSRIIPQPMIKQLTGMEQFGKCFDIFAQILPIVRGNID